MASYLKFDGKTSQSAAAQVGTFWTTTGSIVLTCFVRILHLPPYSAPILGVGELGGSNESFCSIWLNGNSATQGNWFSMNVGTEVFTIPVEHAVNDIPASASGDPVRTGRIYKLQAIGAYDGGGGGFRSAFAVDGEIVKRGAVGSVTLRNFSGTAVYRIGDTSERFSGQPYRRGHLEVIQAKYEFDRTITFDGSGNILTVDADSDPWTDLTMEGTESHGALYVLNEGSGNPQDTSGYGNNMTLTANLDWADTSAEPTFPSAGTGRYTFEHIQGYDLRASDSPTMYHQPDYGPEGPVGGYTDGEMKLGRMTPWFTEDGDQINQWNTTSNFTSSSDRAYEGEKSIKTDSPAGTATNTNHGVVTPANRTWYEWWFYDPGGTDAQRIQRMQLRPGVGSGTTVHMGVTVGISSGFYSTRIEAGSPFNETTTVPISVGWHRFNLYWDRPPLGNSTIRMYIDGTKVRDYTGAHPAGGNWGRITVRHRGNSSTNDHGYWDQMHMGMNTGVSAFDGVVESSGSVVLPIFQPSENVESFDTVTFTEDGTTTKTFRHSTDGGTSWGPSQTLNDANLAALTPIKNGDDALEITLAQTSSMDDMDTPSVQQIDIAYTERTEIWAEESSVSATWSEESGASATWVEDSAPAGAFTEEQPVGASWTEESSNSATWTEES